MILWMALTIALWRPYFELIEAATRKVPADVPLAVPGLLPTGSRL
jgi:hypothetical protein